MLDFNAMTESRALLVDKVGIAGIQFKINENRAKLKPIFKTIISCGHENIPLRGHRDDAKQLIQAKEVGKTTFSDELKCADVTSVHKNGPTNPRTLGQLAFCQQSQIFLKE